MRKILSAGLLFLTCTGAKAQDPADSVRTTVDIEASFPGGDAVWRNYLTLSVNYDVPFQNHAPPGTYTVVVQFIVNKDGTVIDVKALTNHGFGMEDEAIRMISQGPAWNPAIQNGKPVKAYRKQPVTFQVITDFEISTYTLTAGKVNSVVITLGHHYVKAKDIELTISSGTIIFDSRNKYNIIVDKPGQVLLSARKKSKKKKDKEDEEDYGTIALEVK